MSFRNGNDARRWFTQKERDNETGLDARGVVSTYAYDALNRNTSVTYTNDPANTPAIHRYYDGVRDGNFTNVPNVKGR